jgi:hypothetical protein
VIIKKINIKYMKNLILGTTLALMLGTTSFAFATEGMDRNKNKQEDRKNSSSAVVLNTTQMACIKTSVGKREDTLILGPDAYALSLKNAYTARKTSLMSAWDLADRAARRAAVKVADSTFKTTIKTTRNTWNTARKAAWSTFSTERNACAPQGSVSSSETGTSKNDSSL